MDNNKNIDQLREKGWEEMSTMLDHHMPAGKKRPVLWWYWLAGAAALALLVTISWPYLMNEIPSSIPTTGSNQTKVNREEHSNYQAIENSTVPDKEETIIVENDLANFNNNSGILTESSIGQTDTHRTADGSTDDNVSQTTNSRDHTANVMGYAGKSNTKAKESSENTSTVEYSHTSQPQILTLLEWHDFQVLRPDLSMAPYSYHEMHPVKVHLSVKRLTVIAFTEMMWSLSDQFGFLNAGPGLEYDFGKWTLGVSGGIAMPVPGQKTFNNSNQPFSRQYNFSQKLASEALDYNSVTSGNVVYYEKYTMKPGFTFDLFTQVQLSPRWSIGMEIGHIGYGWDFTQKAVPNQAVATRTELTDLKSGLWHGGLTTGFALSEHWGLNGGFRFINPGDPENIGVLPTVRLEYRF